MYICTCFLRYKCTDYSYKIIMKSEIFLLKLSCLKHQIFIKMKLIDDPHFENSSCIAHYLVTLIMCISKWVSVLTYDIFQIHEKVIQIMKIPIFSLSKFWFLKRKIWMLRKYRIDIHYSVSNATMVYKLFIGKHVFHI